MVNGGFNLAEGNIFFNFTNDGADGFAFSYKRDSPCNHSRLPYVPCNKAFEYS